MGTDEYRLGQCSKCGEDVWVTPGGGCPEGHGPECVSAIRSAQSPTKPLPKIVHCRTCGNEIFENRRVCKGCGFERTSGSAYCPNCGSAMQPGQVMCVECGEAPSRLAPAASAAAGVAMKQCPHCKEQIRTGATRCPHCGKDVTVGGALTQLSWSLALVVFGSIFLFNACSLMSR